MQRDIKEAWKSNIERRQEASNRSKWVTLSRARHNRGFYCRSHNCPASDFSCSAQSNCVRDFDTITATFTVNHADRMRKPGEADSDICLSPNPRVAPLEPPRPRLAPAQATVNSRGAVAMVTLFSAHSLPEPRKTVPLSRTLDGRRERWIRREGTREWEKLRT